MILANVRSRLGRDDAQLALRLIARGDGESLTEAEERLRDDGLDALLDDPRLPLAMSESRPASHASLPLFAYVTVRHALMHAGETDRVLADYAAAIFLEFGLRDRATRLGQSDDEVYDVLTELLEDAQSGDATRSFLVRAHLGNYALWLSGLFPDMIAHRRAYRGGPDLEYYEEMGRHGYRLAADHRLAAEYGMATLFLTAAEKFGLLRSAFNEISDTMLFPNHHSPDRLMRQVANEALWRKLS